MSSGELKVDQWIFWMIFWISMLSCLLINYVGLVVVILKIVGGIEDVDKRDGDIIFVGVDGDGADMKLRYVKSIVFNGECNGVVYFADVMSIN